MTVLILSTVDDAHAQAVMNALTAQGARAELVDLSEFPTRLALSMAFEGARRRLELRRRGGGALDLDSVSAGMVAASATLPTAGGNGPGAPAFRVLGGGYRLSN
jgi:hypothetical protein